MSLRCESARNTGTVKDAANTKSADIDKFLVKLAETETHPYVIQAVAKDAIRATFEVPSVPIGNAFVLSLGELVGVVRYAHTLHIPSHTQDERDNFITIRGACRQRLELFQQSTNSRQGTPVGSEVLEVMRHVINAWNDLKRLPELKKKYLKDVTHALARMLEPWQSDSLQMMWHLVEKAAEMQIEPFSIQQVLGRSTSCSVVRKERKKGQSLHPDFDTPLGSIRQPNLSAREEPSSIYAVTASFKMAKKLDSYSKTVMAQVHVLTLDPELTAHINLLRRRDRCNVTEKLVKALAVSMTQRLKASFSTAHLPNEKRKAAIPLHVLTAKGAESFARQAASAEAAQAAAQTAAAEAEKHRAASMDQQVSTS